MRRAAGIVLGAALAGCAVGPNYKAPATPPSGQGPFVSATPTSAFNQPLPAYWWRLYDDPLLDSLVEQALTENQDLKVAAANLAYAQGLLDEARAGRYPSTTLTVAPSYGEPTAGTDAKLSYAGGFVAAYQVDLFGQIRRSIEEASANAEAARAAEDAVRVTVAGETAGAYANACGYARQIAVAENSLKVLQQSFDLTAKERDAGALSDYEVEREGVLLEQTRAAIPPLVGERRVALFTLAALTGRTPADLPPAVWRCAAPPTLSQPLPVGDGAALLRRRPDVRQADRKLAAQTAQIGVATAQLYPNITLAAGVASAARTLGGVVSPSAVTYGIGADSSSIPPLISWSFPNQSLARAHIREARAQASGALASFDSAVLTALKEAEQALSTYAAELDHRRALVAARAHADAALKLAQIQYEAGAYSFLDLLTTQQAAVTADQDVAASEQALSADQVAVFQALGGGWEGAPKVTPPKVG